MTCHEPRLSVTLACCLRTAGVRRKHNLLLQWLLLADDDRFSCTALRWTVAADSAPRLRLVESPSPAAVQFLDPHAGHSPGGPWRDPADHPVGVVVVGALLLYEHLIISPADMRRMNAAFFTLNGVISVVFFGFVAADVLMR